MTQAIGHQVPHSGVHCESAVTADYLDILGLVVAVVLCRFHFELPLWLFLTGYYNRPNWLYPIDNGPDDFDGNHTFEFEQTQDTIPLHGMWPSLYPICYS
jgi:hypothetical protein